jgi:hypothetical protein
MSEGEAEGSLLGHLDGNFEGMSDGDAEGSLLGKSEG